MNSPVVSFSIPVVSFRHLETPFQQKGLRDYIAIIDSAQLPDLNEWREINVRDAKLTGRVPAKIRESFQSNPEMFVFMNRGLVLSVKDTQFDNKTSTLTIRLDDRSLHGLLDGGHTYDIVMDETENLEGSQYVKVELLEGLTADGIVEVVEARNTSNQVREQSLMNLANKFKPLENALKDSKAGFADSISFSEYEVDSEGQPKPIGIRDVIAILTLFERDTFTDSQHPIVAYNSKGKCLDHFDQHSSSYQKMFPMAKELLELYDHVKLELPDLYNNVRRQEGNVTGGRFGRLTGVTYYSGNRSTKLLFTNRNSRYGVPDGFAYPMLAAFRALLEEKNGKYVWGKSLDPLQLLKGDLGAKLANTIGTFAHEIQNPSKVGKTALVWQSCYQFAQLAYLQA